MQSIVTIRLSQQIVPKKHCSNFSLMGLKPTSSKYRLEGTCIFVTYEKDKEKENFIVTMKFSLQKRANLRPKTFLNYREIA